MDREAERDERRVCERGDGRLVAVGEVLVAAEPFEEARVSLLEVLTERPWRAAVALGLGVVMPEDRSGVLSAWASRAVNSTALFPPPPLLLL